LNGGTASLREPLVLINVHPDMERPLASEQDQRSRRHCGGSVFASPDLHLKDLGIDGRADQTAVDIDGDGVEVCFGSLHLARGQRDLGLRSLNGGAPATQLLGADGTLVPDLLGELKLPLQVSEPGLCDLHLGQGGGECLLAGGELGLKMARV
jgi:hypothetical protein